MSLLDLTGGDPENPQVSTAVSLVSRNLQTVDGEGRTLSRCEPSSHQPLLLTSGEGCAGGAQVWPDLISCCVPPGVYKCVNEPYTSLCPWVPDVTTRSPLVAPGMPHQPSA